MELVGVLTRNLICLHAGLSVIYNRLVNALQELKLKELFNKNYLV